MASRSVREPGQPRRRGWQQRALFYIAHRDNLGSILEKGILSHTEIEREGLGFVPVYNADIVSRRQGITTPDNRSLWDYANLYLQPRNAMLYTVARSRPVDEVVVLSVQRFPDYYSPGALITDGNAASDASGFFPMSQSSLVLRKLTSVDGLEYWKEDDGTKRTMMAEVLVPGRVPPELINGVYVGTESAKVTAETIVRGTSRPTIPVFVEPYMFFQPVTERPLTSDLSLVQGDMFFSGMQTLTVSVNTIGVMGAGLASRARYQFPHVYVAYEDMCKKHQLRMGRPALFKTEQALPAELADQPELLVGVNLETWFLLFPTKDDWRNPANKEGIVQGLRWLEENYRREGITSLAMPALGCGLGRLSWSEMGPLICGALAPLDIKVQLYLPTEGTIPTAHLEADFLLHSSQARL